MDTTQKTPRRTIIQTLAATVAAAAAGAFGTARAERRTDAAASLEVTAPAQNPPAQNPPAQATTAKPPLFSGVIAHGGLVFVAGKGEHGPGDIKVHTDSVLNQLEAELKKAGSSMDKVLKCNVYLHDIKDYDGMNEVFRGRFGSRPPVRTTVACYGGIPGQSLVEIDCIAAL
jgi:2-iminobutanoate/2-iminopropanoate deaminase